MSVETESLRFLAPEKQTLQPGDAFFELSQGLKDLISHRAYELFELRGSVHGFDREDWLQAESEILMEVPVEVAETEAGFTVLAKLPGLGENELEVGVGPRSLCITGKRTETLEEKDERGVSTERRTRKIFRAVDLPSEIDPAQASATISNGTLEIKLVKAGLVKKVPVQTRAAAASASASA